MSSRLTDEEVWLGVFCAAIANGDGYTNDGLVDAADFGVEAFRKRFPAEPTAEQELVVEWVDTDTCSNAGHGGYWLEAYLDKHTSWWWWSVRRPSGTVIANSTPVPDRASAKSAAVAALRKELGK